MKPKSILLPVLLMGLWPVLLTAADPPPGADRFAGLIDEPGIAIRKLQTAPGLQVDVFAAEPMVQNPVSFCFDDQGRILLVETFRRRTSVFDIRGHAPWLESDFSFRTVEDRAAFFRQTIIPQNEDDIRRLTGSRRGGFEDFNRDGIVDWRDLQVETERIRMLEDTDGDGRADKVSVFAEDFTNIVAGVAAGILAHNGDVFFTCIPDLWKLRDEDGDGRADHREILLHGFGVHIAFGGHDMHGIIVGPDGRLYWSIADRGTSTNLWSRIKNPPPGLTPELLADSGCIFRSEQDGSNWEVIAWGLRNPQELAFDSFGRLFTADNNGDGGDPARWHYIVPGADYGWRLGWQWLSKMGAWNSEKLWALPQDGTAAYLIPPLAHIGHGPAGLAFYPGTGLSDRFQNHFFLCDFPGSVLMWTNRTQGAFFEAGPVTKLVGDLGPTDLAFAPGGGLYVADWFKTFEKTDRGRLYRVFDPRNEPNESAASTKRLLADNHRQKSVTELLRLLGHADQRVRQKAQFALVDRQAVGPSIRWLESFDSDSASPALVARLHGLWALGQWNRLKPSDSAASQAVRSCLIGFLDDPDPFIRAAAVQGIQTTLDFDVESKLLPMLEDDDVRVRVQAALALARPAPPLPIEPLLRFLLHSDPNDPYVLHAAVMALSCRARPEDLRQAHEHPSARVRMACLLALRRLAHPGIVPFLHDEDPLIVLEAARAIHDQPIPAAEAALAAWLNDVALDESASISHPANLPSDASALMDTLSSKLGRWTKRRALNANYRFGKSANAEILARFAADRRQDEALRAEALEMLSDWAHPPARDKIVGLYRPLAPRDAHATADALRGALPALALDESPMVRAAATRAAANLHVPWPDALDSLTNPDLPSDLRVSILQVLLKENKESAERAVQIALQDKDPGLRIAGWQWQAVHQPEDALPRLRDALADGTLEEKQAALALLADLRSPIAADLLGEWVQRLLEGTVPTALQLDVITAGRARSEPRFQSAIDRYESQAAAADPLAPYRVVLEGGNAARGRILFYERQEAGCFRCHKIAGQGGEVGPDLSGIGQRQTRAYLLESMVLPNKIIAPGYESVLVVTRSGSTYAGQLAKETSDTLEINSPEDGLVVLAKKDIESRSPGLSAMPAELATLLTKSELRDLIAFLAQLP